jgi:hypothetical protein
MMKGGLGVKLHASQLGGLAERAYQGAGVFGLRRNRLHLRGAAETTWAADIPATVLKVRG